MFIVMPFLSKSPGTYGIYAICISITIFLSYADLGFLRAGQKYAAESFARDDRQSEMKFIAFGAFILLLFSLVCAIIFFFLSLNPEILIKNLGNHEKIKIASDLLLILACFTPITVLQRIFSMIFDIRLEGYIIQRLILFSSLVSILSVFYFFRENSYEIVLYFLFLQILNLLVVIASAFLIKKRYEYDFVKLLKYTRFNHEVYVKVKGLAYSGLYVMVVWIIFYELDQIVIGKFLGVEKVALYSIALVISTFFRSIFGIIFSPFSVQANYYVGNNDNKGLKSFCLQMYSLSAPVVILPTIAFALISNSLIITWVGPSYTESIKLAILFSLLFSACFISYTSSMILVATVRVKEMYIIATIQALIFWIGVITTYSFLGLFSFALFKLIATFVSEIYYIFILSDFVKLSIIDLIVKVAYPILIPLIFLMLSLTFAVEFFPNTKSSLNLLIVLGTTGLCLGISLFLYYFTSLEFRNFTKGFVSNILISKS
jgi:O-antigen/teichoic acid export membrane protein